MKLNKKIGLLGVGNMGAAILDGMLSEKIAKSSQLYLYDKVSSKVKKFAVSRKTKKASSAQDLAKKSDVLLLAIKPQDLSSLGKELKPYLTKQHVIISILAGTPLTKLKSALGSKAKIVRAMPNLGARVGESITALTGGGPSATSVAKKVFLGCGETVQLSEKHFDLVTAVSGSGPAYFFLMMEVLSDEARKRGMSRKDAELLAVQTAVGAANLARKSVFSPGALRQMVTSKKGTTEAALKEMKKHKFSTALSKGVSAAIKRGRALSKS